MKFISPFVMAAPKGHYSPATTHGGFVFVSGQLPMDNAGNVVLGTIEEQTTLCLERIATILKDAGSGINQILKVNIFVADINDWAKVNVAFAAFFGDHRPARLVVPSGMLNRGCSIEIDCVAAVA